MKKYYILSAIGLIIFIIIYISIADFNPPNEDTERLLRKIDSLELKIDSINLKKDSLRTVIDSTHIKIIENEKHYQERINIIISQPASKDSSFVSNYIRQYADQNSMFNIK